MFMKQYIPEDLTEKESHFFMEDYGLDNLAKKIRNPL